MPYPRITGGNVITYYSGNVFYAVHTFTTSGNVTFLSNVTIDYLVIGGGGAGGRQIGGGGGAGGFVSGSANILAGTYTVTVGAGGSNGTIQAGNGSYGNNGSNSSIGFSTTITGIGGGGGGYYTLSNGQFDGLAGGSGGGAPGTGTGQGKVGGAAQQPGSSSGGFGFAGGNSFAQDNAGAAGGGGGAGAAGSNGASNTGGAGGAGRSTTISGYGDIYAGGGGGASVALGAGGSGGGGAAGSITGINGLSNRGAGGGGAQGSAITSTAGQGGSGIVIIRYGLSTFGGVVGGIGGVGSTYAGGGGAPGFTITSNELFELNSQPGLAGKFFTGAWRSVISTGNVGTLPLTTVNDSSNLTGGITGLPSADYRYGVKIWPRINYTGLHTPGFYGFIAVGYFKPPTSGTYTFYTLSDDYSGVWVGNIASNIGGRTTTNAVVNNGMGGTAGQGNVKVSGNVGLTANVWYPIRIVHESGPSTDTLFFSWAGPNIAENFDLQTYFRTPVTSAGDILGDYITPLTAETYIIPTGGVGAIGNTLINGSSGLYGGAGGGGSSATIAGGGGGFGIWGRSTSGSGGPAGGGSGNVIILGIETSPGGDGSAITGNGGLYGGGGGGYVTSSYDPTVGNGGTGALMIVWSNEINVSGVSYPQLANIGTNTTGNVVAANVTTGATVDKILYLTGDIIGALKVLETNTSRTGNLLTTSNQTDGTYPVQSIQTLEFSQIANLYRRVVLDNDIFSTAANVLRRSLDTTTIISTQTVINVDRALPAKANTSIPISTLTSITVNNTNPVKTGNTAGVISTRTIVTVNSFIGTPAGNVSANNVIAGQATVTVFKQDEWMLISSDPNVPVDYNTTYNYTAAKPVTTSNDPRNKYLRANYLQKDVTGQSPKDPQEYL